MNELFLETPRLKIVPLTHSRLGLLLDGTPKLEEALALDSSGMELDEHTRDAMRYLYDLASGTDKAFPWITNWQIILKERNISIGSACFMNVPNKDGEVEIGYGIHPAFQCRGYMTEALAEICGWASSQQGVTTILAVSEESNAASHKVLRKCGFQIIDQNSEGIRFRKRSDG